MKWIEPVGPEATILREIADPRMTRDDVAQTYALMIDYSDIYDWQKINSAIIARWSKHALEYIKRRAWQMVVRGVTA